MSDNLQLPTSNQGILNKSLNFERSSHQNYFDLSQRNSITPNNPRMRLVNNNIRGIAVDKITSEQIKPNVGLNHSIYGSDFIPKKRCATSSSVDPRRDRGGANQGRYLNSSFSVHRRQDNTSIVNLSGSQGLIQPAQHSESGNIELIVETSQPDNTAITTTTTTNTSSNNNNSSNKLENNDKKCEFESHHPMANELNAIVDDNTKYFNHISGNCACSTCTCGKHKCHEQRLKIKKKIPPNSTYKKDFLKHQLGERLVQLKNDFFTTSYNNETMNLTTIMQNDYKPWNLRAPPRAKDPTTFAVVPFGGKSAYKGDFVNWKADPVHIEKAYYPLTTVNQFPFFPKTTYKDGYSNYIPSLTLSQKKNDKSPLSPGVPFLGETTTMKSYKPFKISTNPHYKHQEEKWESINGYPQQFSSIFAKDFTSPNKGKCPALDITYQRDLS